jgi:hypothetical protein
MTRSLTDGELAILRLVQDHLGPQNTVDNVVVNENNEAFITARNTAGERCIMLNLTNLAGWVAEGSWSVESIISDMREAC